jgi:hypothetical protein
LSYSYSSVLERHETPSESLGERFPYRHGADVLAHRIALHIESLVPQGRARCLQVGCGDSSLAEAVQERVSRAEWSRLDVHRAAPNPSANARRRDSAFEGGAIPFGDDEFDVALLCDVLHDTPETAQRLLAEAARVAAHVLVKDRFEPGPSSPTMLHADFVDGRRYELCVPKRYFTRQAFAQVAAEQRLAITALDCDLDLHEHLPVVGATLSKSQFIAALVPRGCKKPIGPSKV